MADKYTLISGAPAQILGITCRQPTLGNICRDVGYERYSTYLMAICMTLEKYLQISGLQERFDQLPVEFQKEISILDLLAADPSWRTMLAEALNFFLEDTVVYDTDKKALVASSNDGVVNITEDLLRQLRRFICQSACLEAEPEKPSKFYNKAAQKLYEKSQRIKARQGKNKKSRDENLELCNVISAVCVKHPSYNLTNIWGLTVYQLYDQFFRLQSDVQFNTLAHRWAVWGKEKFDFSLWFKKDQSK